MSSVPTSLTLLQPQIPEPVRALFELSGEAIYLHEPDTGAILSANERGCALLACSPDQMQGLGFADISAGLPSHEAAEGLVRLKRAASGSEERFDWRLKRCSGETVPVEIHFRGISLNGTRGVLSTVRDTSARMVAEEALRRERDSLERLLASRTTEIELIFQALPDVYFRLSSAGLILDWRSGGAGEQVDRGGDWLGRVLVDVLPEQARAPVSEALEHVARTGGLRCAEYAIPDRGRAKRYEARLLPRSEGEVIAIVRDVSERFRAEEALRRSEERFRSVVENSSDLVTLMDGRGIVSYQSPAIERTFGYRQDELVGKSAFDYIHPDHLPQVRARLAEVVQNPGETRSAQFRFRHKDGQWLHVEAVGVTLSPTDPDEGVVVNTRDISDRKEAELALRDTTRFLENLIASSPGVIFRGSGETFQTTYISPNAEAVLGYTAEAFLAAPHLWVERTHPDDREPVEASIVAAMQAGASKHTYEYRFQHSDGEYRNLLASVRFERDPVAGGMEVLGYTFDVSRLKDAEAALRKAKEEAERANRAKSEFLSRMSHELRTPMNSILGFAQLLFLADLTPNQNRAVERIHTAGKHLLNLINEVLDLARIEAGPQALSLEHVQVSSALKEALSLIRPLAAQRECRLDDRLPAEVARYACADRQRLTQVFLNLLSNAVKYNRPGGSVSILGAVRVEESGAETLRVGVHDTGPGIPAHRREELFLPFSRLGADQSEVEGTGLGLALSKTLIEAMGGAMSFESEEGRGSTFWIDLVLTGDPLEVPTPAGENRLVPQRGRLAARPVSILYIEDNRTNLTLIEDLLAVYPEVTLHSAPRGQAGIDMARAVPPDLILLDLHLPDMPGEEVLAQLSAESATRDVPVVVVSADATPERVELLSSRGAREYLTKPLDLDQLVGLLARLLADDVDTAQK
jgi:PAS domain S-box-containing protein